MAARFKRTRRGIELRLAAGEVCILTDLVAELTALLAEDPAAGPVDPLEELTGLSSTPRTTPADPALARLFPDAYRDDREAADEWRRYTETELRTGKRQHAGTVAGGLAGLAEGGRLVLDEDAATAWLGTLNDLRLTLGTRLSVTEDSYAEIERLDPRTPRAQALSVFGWLGWLQETLLECLSRG